MRIFKDCGSGDAENLQHNEIIYINHIYSSLVITM